MNNEFDCVFVTVPFTDTRDPLIAPAILKSIAKKANKSAVTIDLNAEFMNFIDTLDSDTRHNVLAFFREECWKEEVIFVCLDLLQAMADKILKYNPKIVGISVFTYNCRPAAKYLSWILKKINPSVKIILGGSGIIKHFSGKADYAEELLKNNIIDLFIYGDGETALYQYLTNPDNEYAGINSHTWKQLSNQEIEALPQPIYDDYDFSLYPLPIQFPILGSRGCVRKCTFCDVPTHWTKFSFRSGEHIFNEMKTCAETYNIRSFHFTDSLINGNMREYRIMIKLISDYNNLLPEDKKITWSGFFIFRPKEHFSELDWKLTAEGGGRILAVGIETTNDRIRKELGKNFTNEDIDFSFRMAQKYGNIKFSLLFFTGYPTESESDYDFQEQWWRDQVKYKDVIISVNTGSPLGITENTPLKINFDKLGLVSTGHTPEDWSNPVTNNTPQNRIKWNDRMVKVVKECGFDLSIGHDTHYIIDRLRRGTV